MRSATSCWDHSTRVLANNCEFRASMCGSRRPERDDQRKRFHTLQLGRILGFGAATGEPSRSAISNCDYSERRRFDADTTRIQSRESRTRIPRREPQEDGRSQFHSVAHIQRRGHGCGPRDNRLQSKRATRKRDESAVRSISEPSPTLRDRCAFEHSFSLRQLSLQEIRAQRKTLGIKSCAVYRSSHGSGTQQLDFGSSLTRASVLSIQLF